MLDERDDANAMNEDLHGVYSNPHLHLSPSLRFVHYSCGLCGYHLNLNSCNRHAPNIGPDYEKSIKRGIISFFSIDETRFSLLQQLQLCKPYFTSKRSWGLFKSRTKLLCRKCGAHVGNSEKLRSSVSWNGMSENRVFKIKIRALQPSSMEDLIM